LDSVYTLLEEKYNRYNRPDFIESDPVSIPHLFSVKENIELAGFLTAAISWGQRRSIIQNARKLMNLLDDDPYSFICSATEKEINGLDFCHRTFNSTDLHYFLYALRNIYLYHNGLEPLFTQAYQKEGSVKQALIIFRRVFFELEHNTRTEKHIADVGKSASAKRLNMFLRWMVRNDSRGVDFGLWRGIPPSALYIPLDVHTGNVSRNLGLLYRRQNDFKAVEELTGILRQFDPDDPVKYDYALFGMGMFEDE
jgi:uncharacterized protein (TIGR02757 family)